MTSGVKSFEWSVDQKVAFNTRNKEISAPYHVLCEMPDKDHWTETYHSY